MFCPRDPHVPFWKGDFFFLFLFFFFFLFFKKKKSWKKKLGLFEKVTWKFNGPSSKIFFFFLILKEKKNWVLLKTSLGSSMVLVQRNSFFKWLKGPMPLVQTLSHSIFFFSFSSSSSCSCSSSFFFFFLGNF